MDFDTVGKNTGFFSFTKTIADLAANRQFTEGYRDLIQNGDNNGRFDEKTFIWHSLSAISEIVGTTIYENVLNYIDNVSNIDTCKVKALASMSKILGVTNNGILETIDRMPPDVLRFLDIFSINKSYLANPSMLRSELLFDMMEKVNSDEEFQQKVQKTKELAIQSLSGLPSADIGVEFNFPEDVYREFVFNAFQELLSSKIYLTYDGKNLTDHDDPLYDGHNYSVYSNLVERFKDQDNDKSIYHRNYSTPGKNIPNVYCFYDSIDLDSTWRDQIESLVTLYGLTAFDPFAIADRIYNGLDSLDNYSGTKLFVLQQVFKNRDSQKFSNDPLTKYAYYSEKTVVDYLHYVNSQYLFGKTGSYDLLSSSEIYDVDQNYLVLDKYNISGNWKTDTIIDPSGSDLSIRNSVISSVSEILTDMCFGIVDIREKLKTQSQRNYMRGTFLLISYVVSEYLKKNLQLQYPELKSYLSNYYYMMGGNKEWAVDIVEYIDTTEYYNLSTDTSRYALYGNTVNIPFWKDTDVGIAGVGIAMKDIDRFYLSTLNIKTVASDTSSFLNVIYEIGADRGYIDKRTSSDIIVGEVYDNLQEEVDKGEMSQTRYDEISAYQRDIFLNYSGTKLGFDPYCNWKNMAHPSYQIHPYLPRFIEYTSIPYAIKNIFLNDVNADLMIALHTSEISSILGECGQILNIWDRNATTLHGWKTRYENNTHDQITDYGKISPLQHYDGMFYPSAIEDYVAATRDDKSFSELLYSVRNLSSSNDLVNFFSRRFILCNDFDLNPLGMFDSIFEYSKSIVCIDLSIRNEISSFEPDKDLIERLSLDLAAIIGKGPEKTFYEKWYSHLDLQRPNSEKIANQLSAFKDEILDLHAARALNEETYDIYKYGLDKYSNSYTLYKKYVLSNASYIDRRDTPGELWFKFNSHPIGFPLFVGKDYLSNGYLSNISQVDLENMDRDFAYLLSTYPGKRLDNCVYDFDFTNDYRSIIIAYDENGISKYSNIGKFLIAKPYESATEYDEYRNRLLNFQLQSYSNGIGHYYTENFLSDYIFQGFYQDDLYVQGIWSRTNEKTIDLARVLFPDENTATRSTFTTYLEDADNIHYCLNLTTRITNGKENNLRVGYANGLYTLATLTTTENQHISSMTYVGANISITSDDTQLDSIKNGIYGRNVEYFISAYNIPGENNSIDRLQQYLTLVSFDSSYYEGNAGNPPGIGSLRINPKNYNLNPDASYIPLYCGLLGFSRIWAADYYKTKNLQSIELLGYSFNAIQGIADEFASGITVDDDGISSNIGVTEILNSVFRVYEQYDNGKDYFLAEYNDILRLNETSSSYTWTINLSNLVGMTNTGGDYKIQLYNVEKGAQSPILVCDLSAIWNNIRYLSSGTIADNYYLSHNYILPNMEEVVGTPNVFEYAYDPNFASGRSNYILNISGLNFTLDANGLSITFETERQDRNYIIDRGNLLAIVYRDNLHWLENYHFMVPHDIWPYLSVNNDVYLSDFHRDYQIGEDKYLSTTISDYISFTNDVSGIMSTVLSNYTDIEQIAAISSGTYTFKINEESSDRGIKYPGGNVIDELEKVFKTVNIQTSELCNIFSLHNTYIFELDRPKYFADLIGTVALGIYSDAEECIRVYEDYISCMHSVSKFKAEILHYMHFYELSDATESTFELSSYGADFTSVDTELSAIEKLSNETNCLSIKFDDMQANDEINYSVQHTVTEEEIKDFLKLYVNYRVNPKNNETELYFNYNNYFCTPYSYRNKFGEFASVYKKGTYLHLKSGETGILDVIIQIKYYNHTGMVCAVKDIPLMSYKIRNVSDDKPKFVIYRAWTLTPELVKSVKTLPANNNSAQLQIEDKVYSANDIIQNGRALKTFINEDYSINEDIDVECIFHVSTDDFGDAKYTIVYEYSNSSIEPELTKIEQRNQRANLVVSRNKSIAVSTTNVDFIFIVKVKRGSLVDEDTSTLYIPFDAENFKATNSVGEPIKITSVLPGGITLDFSGVSAKYRFLGKEKEGKPDFNGFILGENGKVVRMFQDINMQ